MKKTPLDLEKEIGEHGRRGREAQKLGEVDRAETHFMSAWNSVPEPKTEYEYGQILSQGLVKFYRDTQQFEKAKRWLSVARQAYGPNPDEGIEFLAGTVYHDAGEFEEAFRVFDAQFKAYKQRPFQGEKPSYFEFYKREATARKSR